MHTEQFPMREILKFAFLEEEKGDSPFLFFIFRENICITKKYIVVVVVVYVFPFLKKKIVSLCIVCT